MSFAQSALIQLDSACELFSRAARGFRATKVLVRASVIFIESLLTPFPQDIMLNLQQKAHYSLDEYLKGNGSPLSRMNPSDPSSPAVDDELALLGGKTRYVTKAEPSSPRLMERSPNTRNPVVPLPLPATIQNDVDPNLLHYLRSFQPGHHRESSHSQSFVNMADTYSSEVDMMSPTSMYGMSSAPTSGSFQSDGAGPSSYMQHQQQQAMQQQPLLDIPNPSSFPQYFPVYDYSNSSMSMGTGSNGFAQSPHMESAPNGGIGPQQRKSSSGSPENTNMQTTWEHFVNGLAMGM